MRRCGRQGKRHAGGHASSVAAAQVPLWLPERAAWADVLPGACEACPVPASCVQCQTPAVMQHSLAHATPVSRKRVACPPGLHGQPPHRTALQQGRLPSVSCLKRCKDLKNPRECCSGSLGPPGVHQCGPGGVPCHLAGPSWRAAPARRHQLAAEGTRPGAAPAPAAFGFLPRTNVQSLGSDYPQGCFSRAFASQPASCAARWLHCRPYKTLVRPEGGQPLISAHHRLRPDLSGEVAPS